MCLKTDIESKTNNSLASVIWALLKRVVGIRGRTEEFVLWCSKHLIAHPVVNWYVTQADVMKVLTPIEWEKKLENIEAIDFTECDCRATAHIQDGFEKRCTDIYPREHPNFNTLSKIAKRKKKEAMNYSKEAISRNYVLTWNLGGLGHKDGLCFCNPSACIPQTLWRRGFKRALYPSSYRAKIKKELCKNCGVCYAMCPFDAIKRNENGYFVSDSCMGCGICVRNCTSNAILFMRREEIKEITKPRQEYQVYDYLILLYSLPISILYVLLKRKC